MPWAFAWCDGLKNISIENDTIGEHQFENCDGLESITIPANVSEVKTHAFTDCDLLKNITFENAVIGNYMFAKCSSLESVTIPASILIVSISFPLEGMICSMFTVSSNSNFNPC